MLHHYGIASAQALTGLSGLVGNGGGSSPSALLTDLVAYWKLDEASGTRNDSVSANHLSQSGTVGNNTGKLSSAAEFDASSANYLSIVDNAALSTGDIDFTLQVWVYLDTKTTNYAIVSKGGINIASGLEYALLYVSSSDRFSFRVSNGAATTTVNANNLGSPSVSTWYHIICYHDSVNNVIGIKVNDGTANTTSHTTGVADDTETFYVGRDKDTRSMDGRIDGVALWKRMLTAAEVTELYNSGSGLDYPF